MRRPLICLLAVGTAIGLPALVLQRWIAETRLGAIVLVGAWFAVVALVIFVIGLRRRRLRRPLLGAFAVVLAATVAIGYWTGFRDMVVDEDVAMASMRATAAERERGLGAGGDAAPAGRPVELARGSFAGADGHRAVGTATVIARPDGSRVLTFTHFDADPGLDVDVFLTPSPAGIDGGVELGGLKGNVGDQQYEIPADADLRKLSNVVVWCNPFTVRIAVAQLAV